MVNHETNELFFENLEIPEELFCLRHGAFVGRACVRDANAHRAILEFGDFPHRIQRGIGQQIGRLPSGMQSWTVGHVQLAGDLFKPLVHGPEQRFVTE